MNDNDDTLASPRPPGWGIDADQRNDPTYPLKERTNAEHAGYTWERPPQQESRVEVLHSNERPNLSAVYGTAVPPSGLSGAVRRAAFRYSESSYGHWVPLMLADRINMVEGVLHDISRGRFPNVFAEMGWRAEWQYNRKRFLARRAFDLCILAAIVGIVRHRSSAGRRTMA
jgi:hypothetical protein